MTILFRYILREHVRIFLMCLAGLTTIYLVVEFFEKVRGFLRYDTDYQTVLAYFLLKLPAIVFQIAPLAILMATLLTLGMFARNNEVTAMRSCGVSLLKVAAPLVMFSLLVAGFLLSLSAVIVPLSTTEADYIKTTLIEKRSRPPIVKADRPWIQIGTHSLMNVDLVELGGKTLRGITLYQLGHDFSLSEITEASEIRYTGDGWELRSGVHRQLLADGGLRMTMFERKPIRLSQTPEDFQNWLSLESNEMTLSVLGSYINRLRQDGYSVARFRTDYHGRIAFPFISLVMAIVGIALSLKRSGMRGVGMAGGIGQALLIGFLYWTTFSLAIALGRSGALAPVVAGWIANLLFLSFGLYLLLKVRH